MPKGLQWAGGRADAVVRVRYDSEYAANTARGLWKAKKNRRLVKALREEVRRVEKRKHVLWQHVKAHTGQNTHEARWNHRADRLADEGARGRACVG